MLGLATYAIPFLKDFKCFQILYIYYCFSYSYSHIYIYIYMYICISLSVYIYIYITFYILFYILCFQSFKYYIGTKTPMSQCVDHGPRDDVSRHARQTPAGDRHLQELFHHSSQASIPKEQLAKQTILRHAAYVSLSFPF